MTQENTVPVESPGKTGDVDLSSEIVLAVAKKSIEHVTCRRVTRDHYRCNWWMPDNIGENGKPAREGPLVITNRICKSRFLHVTKNTGGLQISEAPPGNAGLGPEPGAL
ncbi:MAG: hypothetical protein ABSB74_06320 [Tepidisphaeraceae bacterium]